MQHIRNINAAMAASGLLMPAFTCACCGDHLSRDDHMKDRFLKGHTEAVAAAFGENVCFSCADDFPTQEPEDHFSFDRSDCDTAYDEWKESL